MASTFITKYLAPIKIYKGQVSISKRGNSLHGTAADFPIK
jgi:hypothetical protein